jgi:predicted nucleic acid-binding protein
MRPRAFASPPRAFIDTGAYYGFMDRQDRNHAAAVAIMRWLARERWQPYTSNFIRAEAHALLLNRLGRHFASRFLDDLARSRTRFIRFHDANEDRALAILAQYQDKVFSLTDATSFAVMDRLGITHAFAFDRNFEQYGFTVLTPH